MVEQLLSDEKFRSRRFLFAAFVEGFASVVTIAIVAAHVIVFVTGLAATVPPLMPVLWWWSSVSAGVLSIYGLNKIADVLALGRERP